MVRDMPNSVRFNPFEYFLLIVGVIAGLGGLLSSGQSSQVLQDELPRWVLIVWYGGLAITSAMSLIGIHFFKFYLAISGLSIMSSISVAYSLVIIFAGGRLLVFSALITFGFALAAMYRGYQLYQLLRKARRAVANG